MVFKDEKLIEKEIEYLSQLQEKEKFNLNVNQNSLNNILIFAGMVWIPLIMTAISFLINENFFWGFFFSFATLVIIFISYKFTKPNSDNLNKIKENFKYREKRIKERYKKLGVDLEEEWKE